jgi:hypothetical protein
MSVRITFEIPESLHVRLRQRAERSGTSIRSLIVDALEQVYEDSGLKVPVTGPMVAAKGKRGPQFPKDENPHDLASF